MRSDPSMMSAFDHSAYTRMLTKKILIAVRRGHRHESLLTIEEHPFSIKLTT